MAKRPQLFQSASSRTRADATKRESDHRRGSARSRGYTTQWDKASKLFIADHPLCLGCEAAGRVEPTRLVDHVVPHGGDQDLFWDHDNWQPLCKWHHDVVKQKLERMWSRRLIGNASLRLDSEVAMEMTRRVSDGFDHLSDAARERRMPSDLQPSRVPLTIVCGPSGSGKSTYVAERAGSADVVIDLDVIISDISGYPLHEAAPSDWLVPALIERNERLLALATDSQHRHAWFIVSAPEPSEREEWQRRLGGDVVVLRTPLDECLRRIASDPARASRSEAMSAAATRWWAAQPEAGEDR